MLGSCAGRSTLLFRVFSESDDFAQLVVFRGEYRRVDVLNSLRDQENFFYGFSSDIHIWLKGNLYFPPSFLILTSGISQLHGGFGVRWLVPGLPYSPDSHCMVSRPQWYNCYNGIREVGLPCFRNDFWQNHKGQVKISFIWLVLWMKSLQRDFMGRLTM